MIMGFSPQQVDAMSYWQFAICEQAYRKSRGEEEKQQPPSADEFYDMVNRLAR